MPTIDQGGNETSNYHISLPGHDVVRSSLPDGFMHRAQHDNPFTICNEDNYRQYDGNCATHLSRGKLTNKRNKIEYKILTKTHIEKFILFHSIGNTL